MTSTYPPLEERRSSRLSLPAIAPSYPSKRRSSVSQSPQHFLRLVENPERAQLQTSILSYNRSDQVQVDLIGAIHIGEKQYYHSLNERFKEYDILLYEQLKDNRELGDQPSDDIQAVTSFQKWMKDQMSLELQINQIDYSAGNFLHADLDLKTLTELQGDRGEAPLSLMLKGCLPEPTEKDPPTIEALVKGCTGKNKQTKVKLMLARHLQDIERIVSNIEGLKGTTILGERNKHVIKTLEEILKSGKRKVGIFYGAAHMMDLAKRLAEQLNFRLRRTEWRTAWDMDKKGIELN